MLVAQARVEGVTLPNSDPPLVARYGGNIVMV
jgi:hypothetical protein